MDEQCAIRRDSFNNAHDVDRLQERIERMDALIDGGIYFVAELDKQSRIAKRLEHLHAFKNRDRFDVIGLREKIEGSHFHQTVTAVN